MEKGLFITLEGGEGAGKSTQMGRIQAWLEARGHEVTLTRQPGGTPLAEKIRTLVLDGDHPETSELTELLLLFAARAQFMEEIVRPALNKGVTVLCDRFTDSTRAYQGGGRGMSMSDIEAMADLVHGDHNPDLTILYDLPVEQGMARAAGRGEADRLESEGGGFHDRVRAHYLKLAAGDTERFVVIDARGNPDEVWELTRQALEEKVSAQ